MEFEGLTGVTNELINSSKRVSLLYAFNGTGKTRLSMKFMKNINGDKYNKVLYFNAFIEDLFNWNNNYDKLNSNSLNLDINSQFFMFLKDSGKEREVINLFQYYSSTKIEPKINYDNGEISFMLPTGDEDAVNNIKISRGEESIFIWSIFYILIEDIIEKYNPDADEENDGKYQIDTEIEYIFIDDPVSSLDDNHLINVAIDLSKLIKSSQDSSLKFLITTHHPLFYNVLHNENKNKKADKYLFKKVNNKYILESLPYDSPFAYHLELKKIIEEAINSDQVQKYHFTLLRNLIEKTSTFLGYKNWSSCVIENNRQAYVRVINIYSHSQHSQDEYKEPNEQEKAMFKFVFENFLDQFNFSKGENHE